MRLAPESVSFQTPQLHSPLFVHRPTTPLYSNGYRWRMYYKQDYEDVTIFKWLDVPLLITLVIRL
jgi:hypothetical protein